MNSDIPMYKLASSNSHDVLDQQDDPGYFWESKIAQWWPSDVMPDVGMKSDPNDCVAQFLHNGQIKTAYPVGTPQDALASSMYFIANAMNGAFEKQAMFDIARSLKDARDAWDVKLDQGFVNSLRGQTKQASREEVAEDEVGAFLKSASAWSPAKRLERSLELTNELEEMGKTASHMPYMDHGLNPDWERHIRQREEVLLQDSESKRYMSELEQIRNRALTMCDFEAVVKCASRLEQLDYDSGLRHAWGRSFPDSVETFISPMPKVASWADKDLSKLDAYFAPDILKQIKAAPDDVIPTLPANQLSMIKDILS